MGFYSSETAVDYKKKFLEIHSIVTFMKNFGFQVNMPACVCEHSLDHEYNFTVAYKLKKKHFGIKYSWCVVRCKPFVLQYLLQNYSARWWNSFH